jgi:hypothetical protein
MTVCCCLYLAAAGCCTYLAVLDPDWLVVVELSHTANLAENNQLTILQEQQ